MICGIYFLPLKRFDKIGQKGITKSGGSCVCVSMPICVLFFFHRGCPKHFV